MSRLLSFSERGARATLLVGFIVLAWVTLWLWSQTAAGEHFHHAAMASSLSDSAWGTLVVFAMGWTLMTVAMMLPTSYPLVRMFYTMVGSRANGLALVTICVAGYLFTWVLFGAFAHFGVSLISGFAGAAIFQSGLLVLAGVYQFSSLKYHCLKKCRTPFSFISEHWHGKNAKTESFRLGAHHGLFCIGCCWALMLLMFLAVSAHFLWMLVLGTIMAIEKNVSWGDRISIPLGIALTVAGLVWMVRL